MIEEVDPRTGQSMVEGGATLLDVRHQDEWDAGHAPDAVLVPLDQLGERSTEIPADQPIVVICRSGGAVGQGRRGPRRRRLQRREPRRGHEGVGGRRPALRHRRRRSRGRGLVPPVVTDQ